MTDSAKTTLLRLPEVLQRTGLGRSTAYALMARGEFPAGTIIKGTRIRVWSSEAVQEFIEDQLTNPTAA